MLVNITSLHSQNAGEGVLTRLIIKIFIRVWHKIWNPFRKILNPPMTWAKESNASTDHDDHRAAVGLLTGPREPRRASAVSNELYTVPSAPPSDLRMMQRVSKMMAGIWRRSRAYWLCRLRWLAEAAAAAVVVASVTDVRSMHFDRCAIKKTTTPTRASHRSVHRCAVIPYFWYIPAPRRGHKLPRVDKVFLDAGMVGRGRTGPSVSWNVAPWSHIRICCARSSESSRAFRARDLCRIRRMLHRT